MSLAQSVGMPGASAGYQFPPGVALGLRWARPAPFPKLSPAAGRRCAG